jgi:transcriptional regulator with XRE-family HTH domain
MTDGKLTETIGKFVKHHRLNQNKSQSDVARAADISRSTLSLMERGEKVTLSSLIKVLRVLGQLHIMDVFQVQEQISPIEYAKLKKKKRKRARSSSKTEKDDLEW